MTSHEQGDTASELPKRVAVINPSCEGGDRVAIPPGLDPPSSWLADTNEPSRVKKAQRINRTNLSTRISGENAP